MCTHGSYRRQAPAPARQPSYCEEWTGRSGLELELGTNSAFHDQVSKLSDQDRGSLAGFFEKPINSDTFCMNVSGRLILERQFAMDFSGELVRTWQDPMGVSGKSIR